MAKVYEYDKDKDYSALMKAAMDMGDYKAAGEYEQMRNAKIAGEGLDYQPTHMFGSIYDLENMNNDQLKKGYEVRKAAQNGQTDWQSANKYMEGERAKLGYSGGADGSGYTAVPKPFNYKNAPEVVDEYQSLIDQYKNTIMNRAPFSYDPEKDPLYQQYREQYTRNGQQAMQDTLGQVSARTGGLASSYAGSAAQQSYNQYMSALADKIPELRQLAYQMYRDEGSDQRANLDMLLGLSDRDYKRHRDTVSDAQWENEFNYGRYQDEVNNDWKQKQYDRGVMESDREYDLKTDELGYERKKDEALTLAGAGEYSALAELWGLSPEKTQALVDKYAKEQGVADDAAARELAEWYAQYGNFGKLEELGVDTTDVKKMWNADLTAATTPKVTGGSKGSSRSPTAKKSADYDYVLKKAEKMAPEEADTYLGNAVESGLITEEEMERIFSLAGLSVDTFTAPTSYEEFYKRAGSRAPTGLLTLAEFGQDRNGERQKYETYEEYLAAMWDKYGK